MDTDQMSQAERVSIAELPTRQRSKMTNGSQLLPGINGRSAPARRYRDLCTAFANDLGGESVLREADKALVRQAAALTVRSEEMQAALVRGDDIDDEQLTRLMNVASRTLAALRQRKPAKAKAGLHDYLASRRPSTAA